MGKTNIIDYSLIWESLGTFWGQFPDKDIFTKLWNLYGKIFKETNRRVTQAYLSKYLNYLKPIMIYQNTSYRAIFSGNEKNTISVSGYSCLPLPEGDFWLSFPTLAGIESDETLIENVNYDIVDTNKLRFLTTLSYDPDNTAIDNRITLYAETGYRHNPILWNIYASGIGMSLSSLQNEDYLPYKDDIADSGIDRIVETAMHYKYLIWALSEIKSRPITIKNLKDGFSISKGAPFVYRAGTVSYQDNNTIIISVSGLTDVYDIYDLPDNYVINTYSGQEVSQFYVLFSGVQCHDWVTDYSEILSLSGVNELNYTSQIWITYPKNYDNLNHNEEYHLSYVNNLMPKSMAYTISGE